MIWLILAAAIIAIIIVSRTLTRRIGGRIRTTHLRLIVPGLPTALEGARLVMLSDLHVGRLHVPPERLLAAVERERPHILLLGGDYAARAAAHAEALRLVSRLSADQPTFGVMGNTDHHQHLDGEALRAMLRDSGGDLLINEAGRAQTGEATVEVLGVDDPLHGRADVEATARRASPHAGLRIALCHSPALWRELRRLRAHMTLVGHTHGGQIRLPGLEAQVTHLTYPRELAAGLFRYDSDDRPPRPVAGHWRILSGESPLSVSTAEGPLLYVTRGVGMGVFPIRVMCPPELVVIELEREDEAGGAPGDG